MKFTYNIEIFMFSDIYGSRFSNTPPNFSKFSSKCVPIPKFPYTSKSPTPQKLHPTKSPPSKNPNSQKNPKSYSQKILLSKFHSPPPYSNCTYPLLETGQFKRCHGEGVVPRTNARTAVQGLQEPLKGGVGWVVCDGWCVMGGV